MKSKKTAPFRLIIVFLAIALLAINSSTIQAEAATSGYITPRVYSIEPSNITANCGDVINLNCKYTSDYNYVKLIIKLINANGNISRVAEQTGSSIYLQSEISIPINTNGLAGGMYTVSATMQYYDYSGWYWHDTPNEYRSSLILISPSSQNRDTKIVDLPSLKSFKVKAAKKSATVKWKKISKKNLKKIKKIQIQVSPNPAFTSNVKSATVSAKKTSKKIKGLKKGNRYYVRARALNKNHASSWSKVKSVKAK